MIMMVCWARAHLRCDIVIDFELFREKYVLIPISSNFFD